MTKDRDTSEQVQKTSGFRGRPRVTVMNINLTPAIDVTFNLLIFFLVAGQFRPVEGVLPSTLPAVGGTLQGTPLPVSPIKIKVEQTGPHAVDYALKIESWRRQPENYQELTVILEELQLKPGFDEDTPVIIFADNDVEWSFVVNCFNAVRRANLYSQDGRQKPYKNISFAVGS